jgi:hypothetical protein
MVLVVLRLFLKARYPWRADTGTIVVLDRAPGAIGLDTDGMAVGKVTFTVPLRWRPSIRACERPVLYRPDLFVGGVTAPAQVNVYQIVNTTAALKELKGDLAANR